MSEVMREPTLTIQDGEEQWTFDENHSLADIARWIARNHADAEEVIYLLQGMIGGRA